MDPELSKLESELAGLRPAKLDAALAARLEEALGGRLEETPAGLLGVEAGLAGLRPAALSPELLAKLEGVAVAAPFPGESKVVPFPGVVVSDLPATASRRGASPRRPWLAAAAAVALAGGVTALFIGPRDQASPVVERAAVSSPGALPAIPDRHFVPAAVGSDVSNAEDLGMIWSDRGEPLRVIRVVYEDQAEFTNGRGDRLQMSGPREEYILMPEQID